MRVDTLDWLFKLVLDACRACGDHKQAIDTWKKETLPVYKDVLGDHPWTASILRYIASSYRCLAKFESADSGTADQAEMYSREALELRIKLLGENQDTARSHVDLSDILIIKKDFKSAMEQLEEAIKIQKVVLGEQHETTKETLKKLKEIQSMVELKILRKGLNIWDDEVIWQDSQTDITTQMVCLHLTLD